MTTSKIKLVGALSVLAVAGVMGQSGSCVQLNTTELSSCPCDEAALMLTLEGETSVEANTVNLAIVLDGSFSLDPADIALEEAFAKNVVAAFAERNLFENGGTASYVEYSILVAPGTHIFAAGTFLSAQDFNDYVDFDGQSGGGTTTSIGIDESREFLAANPASASFMIVITGGQSESITDATAAAAAAARAEGVIVFAVGAGDEIGEEELLTIGGDAANVFLVENFELLDSALDGILSSTGGTVIPCPSTGAIVTIEFSIPVDSTASGSISGSTVTFSAADLESTPTDFDVLLDVCSEAPGGSVVVSANYTDDQGNTPDLCLLTGLLVGNDSCDAATPAPTPESTPSPTKKHRQHPRRGKHLKKGSSKHSSYLGCYAHDSNHGSLDGPVTSSRHMTTQMCADSCISSGWDYFATAKSSACRCGSSKPTKKGGVCDYECSGDPSTACGGVGCMSVYKSDKSYGGH